MLEITWFTDFTRRQPHFCTCRNLFRMVVCNSVHLEMLQRQKPIDAVSLRLRRNHIEFRNGHKVSKTIFFYRPSDREGLSTVPIHSSLAIKICVATAYFKIFRPQRVCITKPQTLYSLQIHLSSHQYICVATRY
jgi:hypothetical protein